MTNTDITREYLFSAAARQGLSLGAPEPLAGGQVKVLLGTLGLPASPDGALERRVQDHLIQLQRGGQIAMARLDMVQLVRADIVLASEVQLSVQSTETWHCLMAPRAAGSVPRRF